MIKFDFTDLRRRFRKSAAGQRGFSILEMVVAMTIFLVVVATVYGMMRIGTVDRNRSSRRADMLKNARAAMHLIGRDALNAGLGFNKSGAQVPDDFISAKLGLPADADTKRDELTAIIGGNNLFFSILQEDPAVKTDLIAFAYRDFDFNKTDPASTAPGNLIYLNNVAAVSPGATARLQSSTTGGAAAANVYDLYLIESDSSQVAVMATGKPDGSRIDVAPGDPLGLNQALNGTGENGSLLKKCTAAITENCTTYVASIKRFYWVAYRLKSDGTLVRIVFGNNTNGGANQVQEMPLAYNIQDLQFKYVLEDGTVWDDPGTPENFNLVRQISVMIKVQATDEDEQTGKPETITLNSTFSARNLEYDAG